MTRFIQARRYGLPLKMVQHASIHDSMEIWLTLVAILGFGVFIPSWIMYSSQHRVIIFFVSLISYGIGVVSMVNVSSFQLYDWTHKRQRRLLGIYTVALSAGATYLNWDFWYQVDIAITSYGDGRHFSHTILDFIASAGVVVHMMIMLSALASGLSDDALGRNSCTLIDIEGKTYFVAMRSTPNLWLLMPCNVLEEPPTITKALLIALNKGTFALKDISQLDSTKLRAYPKVIHTINPPRRS